MLGRGFGKVFFLRTMVDRDSTELQVKSVWMPIVAEVLPRGPIYNILREWKQLKGAEKVGL